MNVMTSATAPRFTDRVLHDDGGDGVALLAPIALRLGARYDLDQRLVALMCIYGSGLGNFSPLNGLGAIVNGSVERNDLEVSASALFFGNALYNLALAAIIYVVFGGLAAPARAPCRRPGA